MQAPVVSVILPTYNRAHMVGEAIQSVLNQSFADFELIVVDDGSTDATVQVVNSIADGRIRYIYKTNAGLAAARNTGIEHARGTYVAFLDDDDLFLPGKLDAHRAVMERDPGIGWTAGATYLSVDSTEPVVLRQPWQGYATLGVETWLKDCLIPIHAAMIRRSWLDRVSGFDETLRQAEDWDLWLRLAFAGCLMDWVKEPVCIYRLHRNSMTGDAASHRRYLLLMLDKFFNRTDLPVSLKSIERLTYARIHLHGAVREYRVGQLSEAVEDVKQAFEIVLDDNLSELEEFFLALIVAWAGHPLTPDPFEYINLVFDNLPPGVAGLQNHGRTTLARYSMSRFFQASQQEDWPQVRSMFVKSVTRDPSWLRNRGVWSIMGTATLGSRSMHRLRSFHKILQPKSYQARGEV